MKVKKSPICVYNIQFYTVEYDEEDNVTFSIEQLSFDNRGDFVVDETFQGLAVNIYLSDERDNGKGVRRDVLITLVDTTIRCEVASTKIKVSIRKGEVCKNLYHYFPAKSCELKRGHNYKLVISDQTSRLRLAERVVHLFDREDLGYPAKMYTVCTGGIQPAWESNLYKSLNTVDEHDYYVRFNLIHNFGQMPPSILPELEIRLYYPDGHYISPHFQEPRYLDKDAFEDNILYVQSLFTTIGDINGVFYAELLCMEYPIAGFVFDTTAGEDVQGSWIGGEIEPLEEYSLESAEERLRESLPSIYTNQTHNNDDEFDELLNRFINSQEGKAEKEENTKEENTNDKVEEDKIYEVSEEEKSVNTKPITAITRLEDLTGLSSVKEKIRVYERIVRFNKMRSDRGLPAFELPLHAMFLGSPGTGKTTVAKMMGEMLHQAGVLSRGHVVVKERATLLGQVYHSESEKTIAAIKEAQGGILLIDEAYQLYQSTDPRDPGKFVIETLLTALSDDSNRDWMLILAGYPDEMKRMFDMNSGFKSRIPDWNIYTFDDFTETELMEIAENYLARNNYTITHDAREALTARLKVDYVQREKSFGNARHVVNMIQTEILPSMAVRVINEELTDEKALTEIQIADIPSPGVKPVCSRRRVGFAL